METTFTINITLSADTARHLEKFNNVNEVLKHAAEKALYKQIGQIMDQTVVNFKKA